MMNVTIVREIAAHRTEVFEAISTPDGLRAWIGPDAGPVLVAETDLRVGGAFTLVFMMLDGSEHEATGEYLEVAEPHRLVMSWRWSDEDTTTRVAIDLRETPRGTELTFTHADLPDEDTLRSHRLGWSTALDKLVAATDTSTFTEHRVTSGDAELTVHTFGDPAHPCELLVMGAQASLLWWPEAFCRRLAERGRFVIRFDARDTGTSTKWPPGAPTYSMDDMADDLLAILDALGLAHAHVVGVSGGGVDAQIAALAHPTRFSSVTLISSTPIGGAPAKKLPPPTAAFTKVMKRGEGVDWSDREQAVRYMLEFQRVLDGDDYNEPAARLLLEADFDRSGGLAHSLNHFAVGGGERWKGRLGELEPPLLVIHGAKDALFPIEHGYALAEAVTGARMVELAGGHGLHETAWDQIIDAIVE